jgi:hypothetical protein
LASQLLDLALTLERKNPSFDFIGIGRARQNSIAEFVELYRIKRATQDQIRKVLSLRALPQSWKNRLMGRTPLQWD